MPSYAITGATVLAGDELEEIADAKVIIEGGKIASVGRSAEMSVPPNAEHVDASGCVLTPGFIDAHVHISFYEPHDVLAGGVTTVRDLGAPPQEIFELAERSTSADFDGPTILAVGPMLTAPGGYPARAAWARPGTALELADPNEARAAVTALAPQATVIKITLNPPVGPVLDDDTLRAIVDTAHDLGLRVTGHISGLDQLRRALDARIDELAHVLMSAETIPDDVIDQMTNASVAMVPTLSIRSGPDRDIAIDNVARFRSAGGTIVYGTDLGNEGPRPGIDAREVGAMAAAGMATLDIIRSATVGAAGYLGLRDVGAIAPGMHADLVAFEGQMSDGPGLLGRVSRVWRRGRAVSAR